MKTLVMLTSILFAFSCSDEKKQKQGTEVGNGAQSDPVVQQEPAQETPEPIVPNFGSCSVQQGTTSICTEFVKQTENREKICNDIGAPNLTLDLPCPNKETAYHCAPTNELGQTVNFYMYVQGQDVNSVRSQLDLLCQALSQSIPQQN